MYANTVAIIEGAGWPAQMLDMGHMYSLPSDHLPRGQKKRDSHARPPRFFRINNPLSCISENEITEIMGQTGSWPRELLQ